MKARYVWTRLAGERGSVLPLVAFLLTSLLLLIYVLAVISQMTAMRTDANHQAQQLALEAAAVAMRGLAPCTALVPPRQFKLQNCIDSGTEIRVSITRAAGVFDMTIGGEGRVGYGANPSMPLP